MQPAARGGQAMWTVAEHQNGYLLVNVQGDDIPGNIKQPDARWTINFVYTSRKSSITAGVSGSQYMGLWSCLDCPILRRRNRKERSTGSFWWWGSGFHHYEERKRDRLPYAASFRVRPSSDKVKKIEITATNRFGQSSVKQLSYNGQFLLTRLIQIPYNSTSGTKHRGQPVDSSWPLIYSYQSMIRMNIQFHRLNHILRF